MRVAELKGAVQLAPAMARPHTFAVVEEDDP
jgi:hypothetical protein